MSVRIRLIVMSFLQFFVWGAWLITIANYWFRTKHWEGAQFGLVFSTMGIASLFMPALMGVLADRWINAEKLYGGLHICYAATLFCLPQVTTPNAFLWDMLLAMCFYMPTIALSNSISYTVLKQRGDDFITRYSRIRVFGTIGFIAAMWITNITGNKATVFQFYIAGTAALALGTYAFSLPACRPQRSSGTATFPGIFGLAGFRLFGSYKMSMFFVFSMFLGGALQLTNAYGDVFLSEFANFPKYADSFVARRSTIIMSISQISETLFILVIPFFLRRFGIKKVMLMSMFAWVLRFGLFAYGDPAEGLWMIILSCIVYGMAFDFFNISGSLFVESNTDAQTRSSAQGMFMMMTNGFGAVFGSIVSGWLIERYFTLSFSSLPRLAAYLHTQTNDQQLLNFVKAQGVVVSNGILSRNIYLKEWRSIWICFALYALVIALAYAIFFRHKHHPKESPEFQ